MFSYAPDDMERFCRKLRKSAFLSGYASMIYETARYINTHPHDKTKYHLKLIKGTSEKIYPNYHEETQKAFGLKITSEYGAAEAGIIAFECPEGKNMHICMENVYVEVIDGEIVVTNLLSRSFPIIRYKLGDAVVLASPDYKCPCGRNHPVVLDVCGRIGKNILGKTSKYPSLTFYYVFKNIAIQDGITLNYQARQDEKGKITINIEQNPENISELQQLVRRELDKYFHVEFYFRINCGVQLHTHKEKLKDFITTIE